MASIVDVLHPIKESPHMRKLGFLLALATAGAALVAPPVAAVADETPTVVGTHLSAQATPRYVAPGSTATIRGKLTSKGAPVAGQTVTLYTRLAGPRRAFSGVATAVTAADGTVSFPVTPVRTKPRVYRLGYAGDAGHRASLSRPVSVGVKFRSSLRIAAATKKSHTVLVGRLTGRGHGLAHRPVVLQRQSTTGWTTLRGKQTKARGYVRFSVKNPGTYRLVFGGGKHYLTSSSAAVTIG